MNYFKMLGKGLLGGLTFLVSMAASNPDIILKLVPGNITKMSVGALISAAIVALANYLKNKDKK